MMINNNLDQKNSNEKFNILLVDDHPLMRDSLKVHLERLPRFKVVAEASDGEEAIKLAKELNPDIIIMDIAMPKLNGIEATKIIKQINPNITILVLTVHNENEYILKILESGADGYLTKNIPSEEIAHAVYLVANGESVISNEIMKKLLKYVLRNPIQTTPQAVGEKLSSRELQVLQLAAKGASNKDIAHTLGLNLRTIKGYFFSTFTKLKVSSRTEAVIVGLRNGYINLNDIGLGV